MNLFEQDAPRSRFDGIAALAVRLAVRRVAAYDSKFSRKDFTRPQLLACLVLKCALGLTYRGVCDLLHACPSVRETIGLARVPHFTSLESYANSCDMLVVVNELLDELVREVAPRDAHTLHEGAMDSTGLGLTTASVYFEDVRREKRARSGTRKNTGTQGKKRGSRPANDANDSCDRARQRRYNTPFVKISVIVLCGLLLPAALRASWGRSNDNCQSYALVEQAAQRTTLSHLYADAGYDSERLHELCRDRHGIESFIPPVIRTRDGSIGTKYRARMRRLPARYRRRSHVESFFSALKRTTGPGLRAKGRTALLAEAALKVLAYAIRR